jgi:predicted RNA-binding Zn ribbon-like protein
MGYTPSVSNAHQASSPEGEFELTGGALCLDFANTLGDRPFCCNEHLGGYDELLRWSREAEALPEADLDTLEREAADHPRKASAAYAKAIELRETIFRIFASLAQAEEPDAPDLELLNSTLHAALCHQLAGAQ